MELREQLKQHRVKYIVSSYLLAGDESEAFDRYLNGLLRIYPAPLIELALVEILVASWMRVPMPRGCAFLEKAHRLLTDWETGAIVPSIASEEFQQITGLDPSPIFGSNATPTPLRPSC